MEGWHEVPGWLPTWGCEMNKSAELALRDTAFEMDLETNLMERIQQALFQVSLLLIEDNNRTTDSRSTGYVIQILSEELEERIARVREIIDGVET